MSKESSRRDAIKNIVASTAALGAGMSLQSFRSPDQKQAQNEPMLKGNINHSVCRWCYGDVSAEDLCVAVKKIGFSAIDLVGPKDWPILKQHDIFSSMCNGAEISLTKGWNHTENHETLIK